MECDKNIPESKTDALSAILTTMDERFQGEMVLLLDYIKNRDAKDITKDKLLKKADTRFMAELASIVGNEKSEQAYALMMGGLLLRLLNGNKTPIKSISSWISEISNIN